MIKLGIYKHYKGNLYQVLGPAINTDTEQELVLYKALYKTGDGIEYFVKREDEFLANVEWNGEQVKRFEFVSDN